jgi:subtilisin family serine protease
MKTIKLFVITFFCILLSGCNKADQTDSSNSITQTIAPTSTQTPDATPTVTPATNVNLDYSDHTVPNESAYRTILLDLSLLGKGRPVIATTESVADWSFLNSQFQGFGNKDDVYGYDVRHCDISKVNLSVVDNYNDLSFDTDTIWPEKLPEGFDPNQLLEFNKNPGLGIRALHDKGITGKGVSIAIIDSALLQDHEQYKDNLMSYERIHCVDDAAQMHGPAVASIAVGKDIGVAPGAKLYYIASTFGRFDTMNNSFEFDASIIADSILRVLEINKFLPDSDKIRVISISRGYGSNDKGYEEITNAIKSAEEQNVFVITTSTYNYYKNFNLFGMDRDYTDNPDDPKSFKPVYWIEDKFYSDLWHQNCLLVPAGSRTYAGCTGTEDYSLEHNAGLSWASPWCAGFYALCCQVKADLTPQEFIEAVNSTATTTEITHNNKTYEFKNIINPAAAIEKLKK